MRTRSFLKAVGTLAAASGLASFGGLVQAQSALDDVMAKKLILIAVPTDRRRTASSAPTCSRRGSTSTWRS